MKIFSNSSATAAMKKRKRPRWFRTGHSPLTDAFIRSDQIDFIPLCFELANCITNQSVRLETFLLVIRSIKHNTLYRRNMILETWNIALDSGSKSDAEWVSDIAKEFKLSEWRQMSRFAKKMKCKRGVAEYVPRSYIRITHHLINSYGASGLLQLIKTLAKHPDNFEIHISNEGIFPGFYRKLRKDDNVSWKMVDAIKPWPTEHDAFLDDLVTEAFKNRAWPLVVKAAGRMTNPDTVFWSLVPELSELLKNPKEKSFLALLDFVEDRLAVALKARLKRGQSGNGGK